MSADSAAYGEWHESPQERAITSSAGIKILGGIVAIAAALLLAGFLLLVQRSNHERDTALARKQHSYDIVLLTGQIDGAFGQAEAALGRYVINGDRRTGMLYYDQWRHIDYLLDDLQALVHDDRRQSARLRHLRRLYARRANELMAPAQLASVKKGWTAVSLFAIAGQSETLKQISRTLQAMADVENIQLDQRSTLAAARADRANSLAHLLSLVGVLLALSVVTLGWLVVLALADRRAASELADLEVERAFLLERAVAERTGELREANLRVVEEGRTRARAEEKLHQLQKMDAVGQLTGGIAHDFNNMLAVILGGLEMARRKIALEPENAVRHLDSAVEGANRAAALTRRLLSFARAEPLLPNAVVPAQMLGDMSELLTRTIGERIDVRIGSAATIWPVWVDAYQLENALLNLAVNARDAMEGSGSLTMRAANVRLRGGEVGTLPAGDYVAIAVGDTGSGMNEETLARVFEPFFTTKPVGQGTGLGLSQILGFTRQSQGDVVIRSTLGVGTTVTLYLPRYRGPLETRERTGETTLTRAQPGVGTILVVEDDARVRAASGTALTELGYKTILCASGREALEQLERRTDIGLVMTDVVMPEMTGPELACAVRTQHPEMGLLFVTGYVGEAGETESFGDAQVLRKPFTLRALADAIAATGHQHPHDQAA